MHARCGLQVLATSMVSIARASGESRPLARRAVPYVVCIARNDIKPKYGAAHRQCVAEDATASIINSV